MDHIVTLARLDYAVILAYVLICIWIGFVHSRKASTSTKEYFLGGRSMPWWLIGTSMAATNFSIDTPLAITKYVYQEGIGGVWFHWASAISAILATFFFAALWRRSEVMTDVELVERRYSGKPAAFLRAFKGCYFGLIINCFVMGWVLAASIKVLTGLTDLPLTAVIVVSTGLVAFYTFASGFHGAVWTDFAQYGIALVGCSLLAFFSVREVGGMSELLSQLQTKFGPDSGITNFVPRLSDSAWMPLSVFLVYICMQWWAHKYSDGGGKHIQRMAAAKDEKNAVYATFFFAIMNYAFQVWPWILTALCALVIYGREVADPEMTYVWMIGRQMPTGMLGVMFVTMLAAYMSTMSTHINLGGSYFVNDIYKRFIRPQSSEQHYVRVARISSLVLLALAVIIALQIKSVGNAWKFVLAFASGAGLTYVMRWLWWRVNAWTEVTAMTVSGAVDLWVEAVHPKWLYSTKLCVIVGITTVAWLIVTFLTKPVDDATLVQFVKDVQPGTPGWRRIYDKYNIPYVPYGRRALVNFLAGVIFFFAMNFGMGAVLLQDYGKGVAMLAAAVVLFAFLMHRVRNETSARKAMADDVEERRETRARAVGKI